jgi:hypothetical protein
MTRRRSSLPKREMIDERLAEMVGPDRCPLCRFRIDDERRFLDSILWESVNDRIFRARLEKGGGFCRAHAAQILEADRRSTGSSLGAAILLAAGLRARARELSDMTRGWRRHAARSIADARRKPDCPVCAQVAATEAHAAARLATLAAEPAWAEALGTAGFCLVDLLTVWAAAAASDEGQQAWAPVGAAQLARLQEVLARLDGFIDNSSHDRMHLLSEDESRSLREATAILGGGEPGRRG